ncbi:phage tail assembly chaperone [Enterobacteriaceae bacterium H20N1]|uniref:Phage tail assembly chaperone n=1 Tax=Dryocola boscaweniae TaxID=2925397 RepID=A0A9X2W612_9ENTR|nr:tail fiber assembly protein [Dryocola boscaweniae]MCT4701237.1 phage tail assembly chaperone [Dryocola boscaweniae]MCT4721519.1 phage tail assembly chaperone [Dryocola boscaweniae]
MIKINAEKLNEIRAEEVRQRRDMLLAASDWVVLRAQETGEPVDKEWAEYRQNLRDISEQAGYPFKIHWPGQPSS